MAEFRFRMIMDVGLNLIPVSIVITNFVAMRTNRKQPAELFNFFQGLLEFLYISVTFLLCFFSGTYEIK